MRQWDERIRKLENGVSSSPPADVPAVATLSAMPRLRWNHFESMACTVTSETPLDAVDMTTL